MCIIFLIETLLIIEIIFVFTFCFKVFEKIDRMERKHKKSNR